MDQDSYRKVAINVVKQLSKNVGIITDWKDCNFLNSSVYVNACRVSNPREINVETCYAVLFYPSFLENCTIPK